MHHRNRGEVASLQQAAVQGAANAFEGAIDGDIQVRLHILDNQRLHVLEAQFDAAALVYAAAWSVDVEKVYDDA